MCGTFLAHCYQVGNCFYRLKVVGQTSGLYEDANCMAGWCFQYAPGDIILSMS